MNEHDRGHRHGLSSAASSDPFGSRQSFGSTPPVSTAADESEHDAFARAPATWQAAQAARLVAVLQAYALHNPEVGRLSAQPA